MADITYTNSNGIPLLEPLGSNVGYKAQTPDLQRASSAGQFIGGLLNQFKAEYVTLRTALELNLGWGNGWRVVDVQKQGVPGGTTVDSVTIALTLNDVDIKATIYGSFAPKTGAPASVMTLTGNSIDWQITGSDVPNTAPEGGDNALLFSALLPTSDRWSLDFVQDDPGKIYFNDSFTTNQNLAPSVTGAALLGAFMLPMAPPASSTATVNADRFQKIVREYVNGDDANEIIVFNATAASPFTVGQYRASGFSQFPSSDPLSVGGKYFSLREVLEQWSEQNTTPPTLTVSGVKIDLSNFQFAPPPGDTEAYIDSRLEAFTKHVVSALNTIKAGTSSDATTIKNLLSDGRLALETNGLLHITNSPQVGVNNPIPLVFHNNNQVFSFDTTDGARLSGVLESVTSITGLDTEKTTTRTVLTVQGGTISDASSVGEIKSLNFTDITSSALPIGTSLISVSMRSTSEASPIVVTLNLTKRVDGSVVITDTGKAATAANLAAAFIDEFNEEAVAWKQEHDKTYIPLIAYSTSQSGEVRLAFHSAFGDVQGSRANDLTNGAYAPVNDIVLRKADWSVASANGQPAWRITPQTIQDFSQKPSDITFPDSARLGVTGVTRTSGAFSLDITKMDALLPATSSEIKVTGTSQFLPLNSLPVDGGLGQMFRGDDIFTITDSTGTVVAAGNGNDTVIGGDGDNVIEGGGGNDNLSGAGGDDIFIVNKGYVRLDSGDSGSYLYTDPDSHSGNTTTVFNNLTLPGGPSGTQLGMLQSTVVNGGQGLDTLVFEEGMPQRLQLMLPAAYLVAPEAHTVKFSGTAANDGAVVVTLPHLFPNPVRVPITRGEAAAVTAAKVVAEFNRDGWFKNAYGGDRVAFIDPADTTGTTVKFQYVYADGNVVGTPSVQITGGGITAVAAGDVAPSFNMPGLYPSSFGGYIGNVPGQTALGKIFAEPAGALGSTVYQGVSLPTDGQLGFKFSSTWKDIEAEQLRSSDYSANEYYRVSDVEFIQAKSFAYSYDTAKITATSTGAAIVTVRLADIETPIDVVIGSGDTRSDIAQKILTQIKSNPDFVSTGWKAYIAPDEPASVQIIFAPAAENFSESPQGPSARVPRTVQVSSNTPTTPVVVSNAVENVYREDSELIDIRPLYLATAGNDTLYAFSRAGFDALDQVIDRSPNTGHWLADDPLSLFEFNFVGPEADKYYYLAGGAGNDRLIGTAFTEDSDGNLGRDVLDGGAGNDTMVGGGGNDVYYVDSATDVVIESLVDDVFIFNDPANEFNGYDTVIVRNNYVLQEGNSVERMLVHQLYLQNYANNPSLVNPNTQFLPTPIATPVNITGGNYTIELVGHDGANDITAGSMAGMLSGQMPYYGGALLLGMGGNDKLTGGDGSDRLFGGLGNDTLLGGAGNDFFYMGFGSDRPGLDLDGTDDQSLWTSPNKELNPYSLLREWGLDRENGTQDLTGGNDTVTGGTGIDTIVIGSGPNAEPLEGPRFGSATQNDFFGKINFERFLDGAVEKIRISTPFAESMVVDSSVELVRFSNGDLFLLPWTSVTIDGKTVQLRDEKARDAYIKSVLDSVESGSVAADGELPAFIYMPASAGADFVDLRLQNASDGLYDNSVTGGYYPSVSWNGLAGDDIIYAGQQHHRIMGGAGNDWIYSSGFNPMFQTGTTMYRQELYGELGDDTLTANLGEFTSFAAGVSSSTLLLDGGAGNDIYRLSLIGQPLDANFKVEINDIVGNNTLVLAVNDDSKILPYYDPASGTFRLLYADRRTDNGGDLKYQEILSVSQTAAQRTFQNIIVSDEDKFFAPQYSLNLVLSGAAGTAGNDIIVPTAGTKQIYDGAAGDDYILVGGEPGSVVIGGAGFNVIDVVDRQFYPYYDLNHTLSYAWNAAGAFTEINLEYGYSYANTAAGVRIASDRIGNIEAFPNVIGGASNDTITGNRYVNRLEGGAGNDILTSGRNVADTPLGEYNGAELTKGDVLLGGAGNDILVESALDDEPGSLMDGGEGNDTYILGEGRTKGERILTTRIIDRAAAGSDDTIKFRGDMDPGPIRYTQTGSTIRVELPLSDEGDGLFVGKLVTLDFQSGPGIDNNYRILSLQRDAQGRALSFEVAASTAVTAPATGIVMGSDVLSPRLGVYWVNADTAALVDYRALGSEVVGSIPDGQPLITDLGNGYISSLAPVLAQIDRLALDNFEIGGDETTAGMRYKVSFNQGVLNTTEIVMSSTNTSSTLFGGGGTDFILDTVQDDLLIGGEGNDSLYSFAGFDILLGGAGDDQLNFYSNGQILSGGAGADIFEVIGRKYSDTPGDVYSGEMALVTDFSLIQKDSVRFNEGWFEDVISYGQKYAEVISESEPFTGTEAFYLNVWTGTQYDKYYLFDMKVSDDEWTARKSIKSVGDSLQGQLESFWLQNDPEIGTNASDLLNDDQAYDNLFGYAGADEIEVDQFGTRVFGGDGDDKIKVTLNAGQLLLGGDGRDTFTITYKDTFVDLAKIMDFDVSQDTVVLNKGSLVGGAVKYQWLSESDTYQFWLDTSGASAAAPDNTYGLFEAVNITQNAATQLAQALGATQDIYLGA
jgi:Ca2+-binding RTX toxin-like protein